MEFEVANGSWRHGLILSLRCGEVRRQAPLSYDTRIAFPQEALGQRQVQVDVFAKIGTDTFVIDPRTELYDLNIGGDSEGFTGLALRVRSQEEAQASGAFRRRIEDAQVTDEYIEQHDLRHFASQVSPQAQLPGQLPPPQQAPGAASETDAASATSEERLQKARQDAASYVERFDLRQVLQNMFQRVIRERPEDPFGFMQTFLSNGIMRPGAVVSVEADAAEEERRSRLEQEREEQLADARRQLEEQRKLIEELRAGGAMGKSRDGAEPEDDKAKRRELDHQRQLTLSLGFQVSAQAQRIETLEQQLKEARRAAEKQQEIAEEAKKRAARGGSPSADSDLAQAAVHEAAAARDAAVARELAAAAAAVQESASSRDAAVARELATLQDRTNLQRRYQECEHNLKQLEKKLRALERKTGVTVTDKEAAAEPVNQEATEQAAAMAKELECLREQLEKEQRGSKDAQEKCQEAERKLEEARQRCEELQRAQPEATPKEAEAVKDQGPSHEELRFKEAVRQYMELEQKHGELERRCQEAEAQREAAQLELGELRAQEAARAEAAATAAAAADAALAGAVGTARELEPEVCGATRELEPEAAVSAAVAEAGGATRELEPEAAATAADAEAGVASRALEPEAAATAADAEAGMASRALEPEASPHLSRSKTMEGKEAELQLLSERVQVERRCHEEALLEVQQLQRKNQQIMRQKTELEQKLQEEGASSQSALEKTNETCKMLERRIQELEANSASAADVAAAQQKELLRSYEMQLENQKTRMEMLQRKIQAYEAFGVGGDAGVGAGNQAPRGDAAAGGSRGSANKVGLGAPGMLLPAANTASTMPPATASTASVALPLAVFGASGGSEVNTHMLSQLLASTYAPPIPPTTYVERNDMEAEPGPPDPSVLVEVVDCRDVMSNGVFAWVGVCNLRPLYRLLGPEPRYLYYAEADIASNWRIVNKMGSEEFVERFRRPTDAKLPVDCERGDAGGSVFEIKLTPELIQRISMIDSHDEKVTIRTKLLEAYGQQFVNLEGKGRGLISQASPVVAVAHALESQQRAIQLLHSQLSVETQRREAIEQHSVAMEKAFETLQLRIQAQLPGPPSVAALQEVQAAFAGQNARAFAEGARAAPQPGGQSAAGQAHDRGLVYEQDGKGDWAPDLGPGFGPVPHPPIEPKDRKPVPPPSFRRGPAGMRNSKSGPRPIAYPVATGAAVSDWELPPMPEEPEASVAAEGAAAQCVAVE